jgi:hypothetical protein
VPPAITWTDPTKFWFTGPVLQVYDLAPSQRVPEQIQLHAWQWWYNLNLISKDRLPVGEQTYELAPAQKPYEQQQLHSWQASYNLNLIGKDATVIGEQIWERPALPVPPAQTYTASYNLSLIGQDQLPKGAQVSELPPRDFARLFQTWINTTSLALVTAPPDLTKQVHIFDYPNPRGAEPDWRRGWEWSYNKNLISQDQLPFRQSDWPLAVAPAQPAQGWIDQTKIALTAVQFPLTTFAQFDWPNPRDYQRQVQTWINTVPLPLITAPRPFSQTDWPNPIAPDPYTSLRAFAWPLNIGLTLPPLQPPLLFSNKDWPVPKGPIQPDRGFAFGFNPNLPPTPPPTAGPAVYNRPMLAGPGYLNVIPGEKPS